MDDQDPISQFFPNEENVDLYAVLSLKSNANAEDIKKSYRRHALIYHPDKHANASESAKADASTRFQQIGFAYAVLSDEKRRQRYDRTGKTDEGFELAAGEDGWDAYFGELFEKVTRGKLDEMKKEYQGSSEETEDLKNAYAETNGSIGDIMTYIPHSTHDDEPRFIKILTGLINKGDLPKLAAWESSVKDEKARLVRKKQSEKEAKEAEALAKELGIWDEFYGSGKASDRSKKGKRADTDADVEEEVDTSALQALILKRQKTREDFFDSLAAKYAEPEPSSKGKGKKRGKGKAQAEEEEEDESSRKKSKRGAPPAPEIDDEEFKMLQQKLFGDKAQSNGESGPKSKARSSRKGK